jgi:NDP-sugar pyrophosphorylase family protein
MNPVKAIFILENETEFSPTTGNVPASLVDVLGASVVQRTLKSFSDIGITDIVLVAEKSIAGSRLLKEEASKAKIVAAESSLIFRTAEQQFEELAENTAHIFIVRLNAYYELDWEKMIQHHTALCNKVTRVVNGDQDDPRYLDVCLAAASRRNDAAFLLRSGMQKSRTDCAPYVVEQGGVEYINMLRHEADLRALATDALHNFCRLQPVAKQVRPGIWIHPEAQVDKHARLVAPIFVGRGAKVCPGAVITRGTSLEHHTVVGNKTVVENGTILPYSNLGPGLDVSHSIVGERHIFNLQRNVCTPIQDPRLVSQAPATAGSRAATGVAKLFSRISGLVWKSSKENVTEQSPSAISYKQVFDPAQNQPVEMPKVSPGLAAMRRYGNQ